MLGVLTSRAGAVHDKRSAERWLAEAPLVDPRRACFELTSLLEAVEDATPKPRDYAEILAVLHRPIVQAAAENARKFAGRPLPLAPSDEAAYHQVFDLLATAARAYQRLLHLAIDEKSSPLAKVVEHLAGGALEMLVEHLGAHYRARQEVDPELWQSLHDIYQLAEDEGFTLTPLAQPGQRMLTCAEIYARALVLQLAGPYSLSHREFELVRRWTRNWAGRVTVAALGDGKERFVVDLGTGAPPRARHPETDVSPTIRVIQMQELRRTLRRRLRAIEEEGRSPESLRLGRDCSDEDAIALLNHLLRQLTAPVVRQFKRRAVSGRAELASGFSAIHMAIGGRLGRSQNDHWDFTERETDDVRVREPAADLLEPASRAERWELIDETANGFRLRRPALQHRQLVTLRPQGASNFILCEVRWLMMAIDGSVTIGVQALPGLPRPLSAQVPARVAGDERTFVPAFLLTSTTGGEPTLVLPAGWFEEDRELNVAVDIELRAVRLDSLVQRGHDYERVKFTTLR